MDTVAVPLDGLTMVPKVRSDSLFAENGSTRVAEPELVAVAVDCACATEPTLATAARAPRLAASLTVVFIVLPAPRL
jgi:hypothetical protein